MAINCSPGGRMRPTRISPPPPPPKTRLIEKVETVLAVKEFRIDRKSVTGHGSTLFQSFEPLRAIDVHPSGRFTVMRTDGEVNEIFGFDDLDEAVEALVKD